MSHCTPKATLTQIHFKFTPETVVRNVFITQLCLDAAASNTWHGKLLSPDATDLCVFSPISCTSRIGCGLRAGPDFVHCCLSGMGNE